ncbi:MAG: TIGR04086 family membrane protein [Clostridioides sp.]|jgi:putative membrane protein (TIGR04086 family)|nr:TIGR04086 family membrane protein [Clostridioides sp.]
MDKTKYVFKGLGFAYILTLGILFIYNAALTFTSLGADSIGMVASFITTISSAFGGFYASKHIKERGLVYGLSVGVMYMICIFLTVFLVQEAFAFQISMVYKIILMAVAGGIGGVIGVNFSK